MRRPLAKVRNQPLLALGFGAQLEDALFPEKFQRKSGGDSVGNVRVRSGTEIARAVAVDQRVAGFVEIVQFAAQARIVGQRAVLKEINLAPQKRLLGKELHHAERRPADREYVAAAVGIAFGDL